MAGTLRLPTRLDLDSVETLARDCQRACAVDGDLTLDAHEVREAGAVGLQLLTSLMLWLRSRGHSMQWFEPSTALLESAQRLGLGDVLKLPMGAPTGGAIDGADSRRR